MKLQYKIPLFIFGILLAVGIVGAVAMLYLQRQAAVSEFEKSALSLAMTAQVFVEYDMLEENREHIQDAIASIASERLINEVVILSNTQKVYASGESSEIGETRNDAEIARALATGEMVTRTEKRYGRDELCVILPLLNKPECHTCHGSEAKVLGVIEVGLDRGPLDDQLKDQALIMALIGGFTFLAVGGVLTFVLRSAVVNPLSKLADSARRIAQGDLSARVEVEKKDEVGTVAGTFNEMAERIDQYTRALEDSRRELEQKVEQRTRELSISKDYLQTIINSLEDQLIAVDKDYKITNFNTAFVRRTGWLPEQVLGQYCYKISHGRDEPCQPPDEECPVARVWETGEPSQTTHLHFDAWGNAQYVEIVASPVKDSSGNIVEVLEVMRDITERKRNEQEIMRRSRELAALNKVAIAAARTLDLKENLNSALEKVLEALDIEAGAIYLVEPGGKLTLRAHQGFSTEFVEKAKELGQSQGIARPSFMTGRAISGKLSDYPLAELAPLLAAEGLRSFASAALFSKEQLIGTVDVFSQQERLFSPEELSLLESVAHTLAMAVENSRLYEEVQQREQIRGLLLKRLLSAQEEERRRVARELHDEAGQAITMVMMDLSRAMDTLPEDAVEAREKLSQARALAAQTLAELRKLIYDLRPEILDQLGLVPALRSYVKSRLEAENIQARLSFVGLKERLSPQVEITLFRVIQEAVTNIVRHSGASTVNIEVTVSDSMLTATVEDNGKGFDVEAAFQAPESWGLRGMRERIAVVGGELSIKSEAGQGTRIQFHIPREGV
jgi:PAS domain S-box-containing protein